MNAVKVKYATVWNKQHQWTNNNYKQYNSEKLKFLATGCHGKSIEQCKAAGYDWKNGIALITSLPQEKFLLAHDGYDI